MDDEKKLLPSQVFGQSLTSLKPSHNKFAWAYEMGLKNKMAEHWEQVLTHSSPSPVYIPYMGVKLKTVSFDEVAEGWEDMPKKKAVAGKWMPVKKDGKLVADGMIVRRGDSDVPDGSALDAQAFYVPIGINLEPMPMITGFDPLGKEYKKSKVTGPVAQLSQVKTSYDAIFSSAKNSHMTPHEFAVAIKSLSNAAKQVVPYSVVKAIESATVAKYSKHYYDTHPVSNPIEEEVK